MEFNLKEAFKNGYCNFQIAKRLAKVGVKADRFDLSYSSMGHLGKGQWTEKITQQPFYPAIDFYQAILLLEEIVEDPIHMSTDGKQFFLKVGHQQTISKNRTDVICLMYLDLIENKKRTSKSA